MPAGSSATAATAYQTAIFVANDRERAIAEESKQAVAALFPGQTVVTPILAASTFYPIKGTRATTRTTTRTTRPVQVLPVELRPRPAVKEIWGRWRGTERCAERSE